MTLDIRSYRPDDDFDAVRRIWIEVGWIGDDDDPENLRRFLGASQVEVGLLDDVPECAVAWVPGSIQYQDTDLPLAAVTAVTTSRISRKQGLATAMTARAVRAGAEAGAVVAALGIFEQGFYDRLGFATGPYQHEVTLDPSSLAVDHVPYRRPIRLTPADYVEIHGAMTRRARSHGRVVLDPAETLAAELGWLEKPYALGYRSAEGRLTHFVAGEAKGEHGPYNVKFMGYEEPEQLLELLRLLSELADQVHSVRIPEPAEVQLVDLVETPMAQRRRTWGSVHQAGVDAFAWLQLRLLDVARGLDARRYEGPQLRFNLVLTDPIEPLLTKADDRMGHGPTGPDDAVRRWPGAAGSWTVTLGPTSSATPGLDRTLPTVEAAVGPFTRCWLGIRPATRLALTADLSGPDEVLSALDDAFGLPLPVPGWEF